MNEVATSNELGDARRYAVVSGAAVALLFAIGNAIWALDMPEDGTAVGDVVAFYAETADRIVIGGSLSLLAIAVLALFAAAVRRLLIASGGDEVLATTAFGGAVLTMAAGLGAESINMAAALRARDDELSEALAQSLFETSQMLGSAASGVGLGVFAVATACAALRAGSILPRPLAIAMVALGLVLLSPLAHVNWVAGAALVLITGAVSVALLLSSADRAT